MDTCFLMSYSWIYHQEEVLLTTYMVHTYLHIHWPTFSSTCWQFEGWTHNPGHLFKHWIHASWCPIHGFTIRRRSYWQFTGCIHTYTYTGPPFQALADNLKDECMTWPPFQALADNLKGGSPSLLTYRVPKTSPQAEFCHKKGLRSLTDKKPQHPRFPCGPPPWY